MGESDTQKEKRGNSSVIPLCAFPKREGYKKKNNEVTQENYRKREEQTEKRGSLNWCSVLGPPNIRQARRVFEKGTQEN